VTWSNPQPTQSLEQQEPASMRTVTALPIPSLAPLLYRVEDAAHLLSLSRSVIFELLRSGRLRSVQEGRARLIPATAMHEYIVQLENEAA
jgi:excisionase family DNA binding protein